MVTDFNSIFSGIVKASELSISSGQALAKIEAEVVSGSPLVDLWLSSDANLANQLVTAGQVTQYSPSVASKYPASSNKSGYYYPAFRNTMVSAWNSPRSLTPKPPCSPPGTASCAIDIWTKTPGRRGRPLGRTGYLGAGVLPAAEVRRQLWSKLARYSEPRVFRRRTGLRRACLGRSRRHPVQLGRSGPHRGQRGRTSQVRVSDADAVHPAGAADRKERPAPNAAKLLDEFVLSQYGQELANKNGQATYLPGITDTRTFTKDPWYKAPSESNLATYDQAAYVKALPSLTKSWESAYKTG